MLPRYEVVIRHHRTDDHDLYGYYYASGEDFSGLSLQAPTIDVLMERVNGALAQLFEVRDFEVEYRLDYTRRVSIG